jgi:pyrroloquinoline quinone (PQQ) biosynthesis protein C
MSARSVEELMDELDRYIAENRYSRHSFVGAIADGRYTKEGLRRWAVQKYFQTREQNCVHGAVHFNSRPYLDVRQYQVEQLVDEETAEGEGSAPHYLLIKRLADALGATEADYARENIGPGVHRFVDYLLKLAHDEHPTIGMMGSYINERQTPESATKMYNALKAQLGYDDATLEWFICHAGADVEHADTARNLIIKYAGDVPDFHERAWRVVKNGIVEWKALQDYYYSLLGAEVALAQA